MFQLDEFQTMAELPAMHARQRPENIAQIFGERQTTYGQFDRYTSQVANGLGALNVGVQKRIGYLGKNSDWFFELLFGAFKANAVVV